MDDETTDSLDGAASLGDLRAELIVLVLERAYTRSAQAFRLASGGMSNDYVDMRRGVGRGEDLQLAAKVVISHLAGLGIDFDAIGGMTMGADPISHAIALLDHRSWYSVRKAEKEHGIRRRIEGCAIGPGVRAVVFEDTVSTGRSLLDAVDVVASTGATITGACTLLDRADIATEAFRKKGVPYSAVLTYRDIGIEPLTI